LLGNPSIILGVSGYFPPRQSVTSGKFFHLSAVFGFIPVQPLDFLMHIGCDYRPFSLFKTSRQSFVIQGQAIFPV
jgi:hypothetical protein